MTKRNVYKDILEADNGDIAIINNEIILTPDSVITGQNIKRTLMTCKGEWFLDADMGMPYLDEILVNNPDLQRIEALFIRAVESVEQVVKIISLKVRLGADRKLIVNISVLDDLGNVVDVEV